MSLSLGLGLALTRNKGVGDPTLLWDEDFVNGVYRYNRVRYPAITDLPMTTFTRATTKYAANSAGVLVPFSAGVPAITDAGLSVEPAATNLLLRSQEFDNAAWTPSQATISANVAVAPDGTTTADKLVSDATAGSVHRIFHSPGLSDNTDYTFSIFAKAGEFSKIMLTLNDKANALKSRVFDLVAGTSAAPEAGFGAATSYGMQALGDGWYRCWVTVNSVTGAGSNFARVYLHDGTSVTFDGNGTSGSYIWGGQLEVGAYATSYIPTTTVAVTRNADALASADTVISPTIVAEFTVPLTGPGYANVWSHSDVTTNHQVILQHNRSLGRMELQVDTGAVNQAYINLGAVTPGATYKVAVRIAANDVAASLSGAAVVADTSVTLPTVTEFAVGRRGFASYWGSGIRRIRRYSTAKTNAELQALSA